MTEEHAWQLSADEINERLTALGTEEADAVGDTLIDVMRYLIAHSDGD